MPSIQDQLTATQTLSETSNPFGDRICTLFILCYFGKVTLPSANSEQLPRNRRFYEAATEPNKEWDLRDCHNLVLQVWCD